MAVLTLKKFSYWIELLQRMVDADANSGYPLRDDLKAFLVKANGEFSNMADQYISLRSQQKALQTELRILQDTGQQHLRTVRHVIKSTVKMPMRLAVMDKYRLTRQAPRSREKLLGLLRIANQRMQTEEETGRFTDDFKNALQKAFTELNAKIEALNGLQADIEEAQQKLKATIREYIIFREQVHSYLVSTLPEKHRDPRLIDYGVRKTVQRRRGSVPSSPSVRVITEDEVNVPAPGANEEVEADG